MKILIVCLCSFALCASSISAQLERQLGSLETTLRRLNSALLPKSFQQQRVQELTQRLFTLMRDKFVTCSSTAADEAEYEQVLIEFAALAPLVLPEPEAKNKVLNYQILFLEYKMYCVKEKKFKQNIFDAQDLQEFSNLHRKYEQLVASFDDGGKAFIANSAWYNDLKQWVDAVNQKLNPPVVPTRRLTTLFRQ